MKPVVMFARTQLEVVATMWRIRRAALEAIESTGAVRITIEPAPPAANEARPGAPVRTTGSLLAAARMLR